MSTKDLNLYETGSGGDIAKTADDLVLTEQLYQAVYLCLFGGNTEASTQGNEVPDQIRNDWWGNSLLFSETPAKQFNSLTEVALRENTLNSRGRVNILAAVQADLENFKMVADITANVVILSTNSVGIIIKLTQPEDQQEKILQFIWDNAKNELILDQVI